MAGHTAVVDMTGDAKSLDVAAGTAGMTVSLKTAGHDCCKSQVHQDLSAGLGVCN